MILEIGSIVLAFGGGYIAGASIENRDWIENKLPDMYFSWRMQHDLVSEVELQRRCEVENL